MMAYTIQYSRSWAATTHVGAPPMDRRISQPNQQHKHEQTTEPILHVERGGRTCSGVIMRAVGLGM